MSCLGCYGLWVFIWLPVASTKQRNLVRQTKNKSCWSLGAVPHPSLAEHMDKTYVLWPILLPLLFPLPFHYIFYWTLQPHRVSCGIQSKTTRSILLQEGNFNMDVGGIRTGDETARSVQSRPPSLHFIEPSCPNGASLTQSPADSPCDTLVQCSLSAVIVPNKVLWNAAGLFWVMRLRNTRTDAEQGGKRADQPMVVPLGFSCSPVHAKQKHRVLVSSSTKQPPSLTPLHQWQGKRCRNWQPLSGMAAALLGDWRWVGSRVQAGKGSHSFGMKTSVSQPHFSWIRAAIPDFPFLGETTDIQQKPRLLQPDPLDGTLKTYFFWPTESRARAVLLFQLLYLEQAQLLSWIWGFMRKKLQ